MKILGFTIDGLIDLVQEGVRLLNEKCGIEGNSGYFTVFDGTIHRVVLMCKIGSCATRKSEKYFTLSGEKARRLSLNSNHISSFQSRNKKREKWGGAVRAGSTIFSFSGLSELADEALMVFVAHQTGWLDGPEGMRIAGISGNPYIEKILIHR